MRLYPYTVSDVSPNALRSTYNPAAIFLGRRPRHGNSGNHPEITDGWCGTTNDSSVTALGEVDLDDPDWLERLVALLPGDAKPDREAIQDWAGRPKPSNPLEADDTDDDGTSWNCFAVPLDTRCESEAFSWDENPDSGDWFPQVRDGWEIVASSDPNGDDISGFARTERLDTDCIDWVEGVLQAATIVYDRQDHDTYSSKRSGRDWAYIAVRAADLETATAALRAAYRLLESDD